MYAYNSQLQYKHSEKLSMEILERRCTDHSEVILANGLATRTASLDCFAIMFTRAATAANTFSGSLSSCNHCRGIRYSMRQLPLAPLNVICHQCMGQVFNVQTPAMRFPFHEFWKTVKVDYKRIIGCNVYEIAKE